MPSPVAGHEDGNHLGSDGKRLVPSTLLPSQPPDDAESKRSQRIDSK